jgi:cellulose synthase/poly-beta-1,6-N-acetylglucosamine synthase-like glycosyltransferase
MDVVDGMDQETKMMKPKIDYFIPAMGQHVLLQDTIELLCKHRTRADTVIHVIDNGSAEPIAASPLYQLHRQEDNLGMIQSLKFAQRHSDAQILIYSHSDFLVFEPGWDEKIMDAFANYPRVGLIGTVGAVKAAGNGGREEVYCAFRSAAGHGTPAPPGLTPVTLLDGCFMAFRRAALDRIGIDESFNTHHFYDKDWSLTFALNGSGVGVLQLDCEHLGGQTTVRPEYQRWANRFHGSSGDHGVYLENEARYIKKHKDVFPVRVTEDWVYHTKGT